MPNKLFHGGCDRTRCLFASACTPRRLQSRRLLHSPRRKVRVTTLAMTAVVVVWTLEPTTTRLPRCHTPPVGAPRPSVAIVLVPTYYELGVNPLVDPRAWPEVVAVDAVVEAGVVAGVAVAELSSQRRCRGVL